MKRCSYIIVLLAVCMPFFSVAQEKKPGAMKKAPKSYEAFFKKDIKKLEGTFPVYRDAQKCYVEIPAASIGKDLLVSGALTKGQNAGVVSSITSVLVFNVGPKGDQLEVKQQICSDRASGDMAGAVAAASLKPVLFSYPIVAYGKDKQGYIIDITSDVNASGKLFSFPNQSVINTPAADRSFLDTVLVINDGVKFMSLRAQSTFTPGIFGMPGRDTHNAAWVEWSLQQLPDRTIAERHADPRIGYDVISYNDYDKNPNGVKKETIVKRWNLQVTPEDMEKYKRGELVEPVLPIRVYFDKTFSPALRSQVLRGVEEWNRCFEAAGFKNVLQVQDGEPEVRIAYHQIVYSYVLGAPQQTIVSDARTGEILSACVGLSCQNWNDNMDNYTMQLGGYEPKVFTDSLPVVFTEYFRYRTSNTLGQVLGLLPNFAGSMAYTTQQLRDAAWVREHGISASVTDGCIFNFAAQPGDGMTLRELFSKASDYDRWAIEWGYRQFPGMDATAEHSALKAIAAKAKNNPALYYAPAKSFGYRVNPNDLGQNKLQTALLGLENLKRLSSRIEEIADQLDKKDDWMRYTELVGVFRACYGEYVKVALDYLENSWYEPVLAGFNDERVHYLPKSQKKEMEQFVNKYIFSGMPAWLDTPDVESVHGANVAMGMNLLIMPVAKNMLEYTRLMRLMEAQEKAGDRAYTLDDLFALIDNGVFLNYSASKPVDLYRARLQHNFVKEFLTACLKLNVTGRVDQLCFYLQDRAAFMTKKFEELGRTHSDLRSRQYYKEMGVIMKVKWNTVENAAKNAVKK
ncbi:zinc-dependent metalloprotease [Butyricimonas synergistica]|uniref:DUF5117 and DUF5118 domain-containing protein n=1 Tax=Butyricimonas synergistica TaxID=544644 RepID=UPI00058D9E47|nr:zinc-dependent metalloprotease [Butyricimonas synergistica]